MFIAYDQFRFIYESIHALDIYHNDLQNANIYLKIEDEMPIVKIIDFGLARTRQDTIKLLRHRGLPTDGMEAGKEFQGERQLERYFTASEML